jgi:hypothetical protein
MLIFAILAALCLLVVLSGVFQAAHRGLEFPSSRRGICRSSGCWSRLSERAGLRRRGLVRRLVWGWEVAAKLPAKLEPAVPVSRGPECLPSLPVMGFRAVVASQAHRLPGNAGRNVGGQSPRCRVVSRTPRAVTSRIPALPAERTGTFRCIDERLRVQSSMHNRACRMYNMHRRAALCQA